MIQVKSVSRCLDRRAQIFGYDLIDIFLIFILLSSLNFCFGQTHQKLLLIWIPSVLFALGLRLMKAGKPENYLLHLLKFHLQPKLLFVFADSTAEPYRGFSFFHRKFLKSSGGK